MANPSKNRGTRTETALCRWLADHGFPQAIRQPLSGNRDQGDIVASHQPRIILEVKYRTGPVGRAQLEDWWDQTALEAVNAGADLGALVVHRPRVPLPMWDVWCPASDWASMWTGRQVRFADGEPWLMAPLHTWAVMASDWADREYQWREANEAL